MVGLPEIGPSMDPEGDCALQTEKNTVAAAANGRACFIVNTSISSSSVIRRLISYQINNTAPYLFEQEHPEEGNRYVL
jgi:hypothetical protein